MLNSYCTHRPFAIIDNVQTTVEPKSVILPTSSPEIFGPPTWAYLHISTANLPENLSPSSIAHVRNTIFAVPTMVPCEKCTVHMGNYLESRRSEIEKMTKGGQFFNLTVDMHNFVNSRIGKQLVSYNAAMGIWKGQQRKVING